MTRYERLFAKALAESGGAASPIGRRRLHGELTAALVRRRRWRRGMRTALTAAALVLGALAVWPRTPAPPPVPPPGPEPADPRFVRNDPGIVARCTPPPGDPRRFIVRGRAPDPGVFLDDDALLKLLRRAGRPSGLLRTGGRVHLTADVFDPIGADE